jgi:hypothetical protein
VWLRGAASPDEIAAVTAVLAALSRHPATLSGYERWRAGRLAAIAPEGSIRRR